MAPRLFALAERDEETNEPDPERVLFWGMEVPVGTILYWRERDGRSQFATFPSADRAESRFGDLFDVALIWW